MSKQQIFNVLVEFFEEDGWDFQWVSGLSVLSLAYSGSNGRWMCYAQARETQHQFVFYSVLPVNASQEQHSRIAEFITRANYGMIMGNFEMDYMTGEIRYKTSIDIEGAELSMPLIRQIVYSNLVITDHYLPGVMRVLYSDVSPADALETLEEYEDEQPALDLEDLVDLDELDDFDDDDDDFDDDDFDDDDDDDDDFDDDDDPHGPFDDEPPTTNGGHSQ